MIKKLFREKMLGLLLGACVGTLYAVSSPFPEPITLFILGIITGLIFTSLINACFLTSLRVKGVKND